MSKAKKGKENQIIFLISGLFVTAVGIYINYEEIIRGEFPDAIMLLALGLNQLMFAYLSPHLFPRDERSKEIIGKAMFINYFVLFGSIGILFMLTGGISSIILDGSQVLIVLFCIMALTIPATMIIYSKLI